MRWWKIRRERRKECDEKLLEYKGNGKGKEKESGKSTL